jgi:hypothetical protein
MPCADGYACSDEVTEATTATNTEHSSEEEDFCSPFCVCACCAQSAWTSHLSYEIEIALINQQIFVYTLSNFSSQIQNIWQPPKLS